MNQNMGRLFKIVVRDNIIDGRMFQVEFITGEFVTTFFENKKETITDAYEWALANVWSENNRWQSNHREY